MGLLADGPRSLADLTTKANPCRGVSKLDVRSGVQRHDRPRNRHARSPESRKSGRRAALGITGGNPIPARAISGAPGALREAGDAHEADGSRGVPCIPFAMSHAGGAPDPSPVPRRVMAGQYRQWCVSDEPEISWAKSLLLRTNPTRRRHADGMPGRRPSRPNRLRDNVSSSFVVGRSACWQRPGSLPCAWWRRPERGAPSAAMPPPRRWTCSRKPPAKAETVPDPRTRKSSICASFTPAPCPRTTRR